MSTTPKLDEYIEMYNDIKPSLSAALQEIRDHIKRCEKAFAVLKPEQFTPQSTRYPSEIESRLIELVEQGIADLSEFNYTRRAGLLSTALAAIKRDLGLT